MTIKLMTFLEFVQQCDTKRKVTQAELDKLENYLDKLWSKLNIDVEFSTHFADRLNDARNKKQITVCELKDMFDKAFKKHGNKIKMMKDLEGVLSDLNSDVNMPFGVNYDPRKKELELAAVTVMRKKNFKPNSLSQKQLKV